MTAAGPSTATDTVLPGFLDAHVHLALADAAAPAALLAGGISRVLDLGGWRLGSGASGADRLCVRGAGQLLTAPGGYPSRAGWAPPGSVCEVSGAPGNGATDAAGAVDRQLAGGASVVKITLNSAAGPVFPGDVLAAIVGRAHDRGVTVVVHAQGRGQAQRAFTAGVDAFAHTPFSERLDDELIAAMAGSMTWISTLDIHGWGRPSREFDTAVDNLGRFHAHGGRMLYGTDLGNGPLPVGLNRREIGALLAAGLSTDAVIATLTSDDDGAALGIDWGPALRHTRIAGPRPASRQAFADWLCTARSVSGPLPAPDSAPDSAPREALR
ncbi:amidohydrolase [Cryobacterium frigoriphilum]|uniref:Amidohydrolase n=1 Tax=Cryobacterium frigoriphilum TaxID=1259150 RepID=A0A4R9AAT5_9MICO|nr:amidohydrolase family protein [Cryobacterium frigoriphilum]TFD55524.1 amidohydrolase [Cryobacterium frigoriphilum]